MLTLGSANVLGTSAGGTTISGTIDLNGYSITGEAITGGGKGHDGASGFLVNNSATAASVTGSTFALTSASGNYIGGTGNMTIGSAISAPLTTYWLYKVGNGEITLAGDNTYGGKTLVTAGTLTLSGNNSAASGGVTLTAGTLNINNNNALGSGALSLAGTGATINNTSGTAVVNAGNQAWTWSDGLAFGASGNTAANNLNLGTGVVTANSSRTIALAGTGTKLTIGAVNITSTSGGRTITANGAGNTLEMGGVTLSASATPVTVTLAGTANLGVTGAIVNGTTAGNGLTVTASGTTTLSGNNTYTGLTTMNNTNGTLTLSGNNSSASGGVTLTAGTLNVNSANALGSGTLTLSSGGTINNTSGQAVTNAVNNAVTWGGDFTFGNAGSTNSLSNLNLGAGTVTASTDRGVTFAGTNTTLKMGAVNITSIAASGKTITATGAGNTLEMGGLTLSAGATPVAVTLAGTANIRVTGTIANGTTPGNGLTVTATGTTTLSGNNTYTGLTTMNASGGTLNLTGNNSSATGGTFLTTGTLNLNNANALSTGLLELSAVTGTAYGSSIINNTSGGALTFSGLSGVKWTGVATNGTTGATGIQFGTSGSTSANNMDFGTGLVTAASDRAMNIAGTDVTISMGILTTSGTAGSYTYKIDGAGNTLDLDGWRISGAATPTQAVQHKISATANVNIGTIENGTGAFANSAVFMTDGTTRLTGNNTYTGTTEFVGSGTNIISGNNSAAVGNVTIAGTSGSGKTPVVRLDNVNGISSSSSLLGASGNAQTGTLDLRAAGNFSLNSFGTVSTAGNNMIFTNSSGSQKTLTFTAANNYITTASTGGKTLYNNSANLLLDFNGNVEIGGESAGGEATTFAGVGNFNVDGNLLDTGSGLTRTLRKTGDGTLTLRGSANSIRGSTLVETGTLDLYGNISASTNIAVSTSGTSANTGVRTASATVNVRSGASLLNSSTTTVWSRGNLIVDGTAGAVVVENNGLLGGSGAVGSVNLKSGAFLNPGNSPGLLTASSASWAAGSTYNWEIDSNASSAVAGTNWDLFSVTGALDMSALKLSTQMNLVLNSLSGFDLTSSTNRTWVIARADSLLGTGNTVLSAGANVSDYFSINATAFTSATPSLVSEWRIEVGETGKTLNLMAIPEPSTGTLLGFGFGGLVFLRLLRRRNS
jgi:autotransporter-associated beta strand protein